LNLTGNTPTKTKGRSKKQPKEKMPMLDAGKWRRCGMFRLNQPNYTKEMSDSLFSLSILL
jgi:hypothetical protein